MSYVYIHLKPLLTNRWNNKASPQYLGEYIQCVLLKLFKSNKFKKETKYYE